MKRWRVFVNRSDEIQAVEYVDANNVKLMPARIRGRSADGVLISSIWQYDRVYVTAIDELGAVSAVASWLKEQRDA